MVDTSGCGDGAFVGSLEAARARVLGVLVEKAKTTPEYYPMTVAAIVTACNQKSNRDPVTNYDQDDVEETLHGLAEERSGDSGRGERPGREVEAHALRLAESEQGRAGRHGRAALAGTADRGRAASPGQPDGAACGPACACRRSSRRWRRGAWCNICRRPAKSAAFTWRTGFIRPKSSKRCGPAFASRHAGEEEVPTRLVARRGSISPRRRLRQPGSTEVAAFEPKSSSLRATVDALAARSPRTEIGTRSLTE